MTNLFSFFPHTKVAKIVLSGEPDNNIGRTSFFEVLSIFLTYSNDFFQAMTNIFCFLAHAKVAKVVLSGEPRPFQALWHLLKGF